MLLCWILCCFTAWEVLRCGNLTRHPEMCTLIIKMQLWNQHLAQRRLTRRPLGPEMFAVGVTRVRRKQDEADAEWPTVTLDQTWQFRFREGAQVRLTWIEMFSPWSLDQFNYSVGRLLHSCFLRSLRHTGTQHIHIFRFRRGEQSAT